MQYPLKTPKHIIFDLDHTLWDFDANSRDTLADLVVDFESHIGLELDFNDFFRSYQRINLGLWKLYRNNQVDVAHLRRTRFVETFSHHGVSEGKWMADFSARYLETCPTKTKLMEGTIEMLDYLQAKQYALHIITNGFTETQSVKMDSSGLRKYFDLIVTTDMAGAKKPNPVIFHYALERLNETNPDNVVYIGDSYEADVLGGKGAGLPVIFYNPTGKENPLRVKEIKQLSELIELY